MHAPRPPPPTQLAKKIIQLRYEACPPNAPNFQLEQSLLLRAGSPRTAKYANLGARSSISEEACYVGVHFSVQMFSEAVH